MTETQEDLMFVLLLIITVFGSMVFSINFAEKYTCSSYQEETGRETKYSNFDGCYIKHNDNWYSKDEYGSIILLEIRTSEL